MSLYRLVSRSSYTSNIKKTSAVCYNLPFKGKNVLYHSIFHGKVLESKETIFPSNYFCTKSMPPSSKNIEDLLSTMTVEQKQKLIAILQDEMKAHSSPVQPPTSKQLFQVGLHHSLPFIGFGFLDNFIMILAGDYIDLTIGTMFGISTMAAAALGNAVSDVAGVGSAQFVESFAAKLGVPSPNLDQRQASLHSVVWSINIGRAIGVAIGCVLGMVPLLFLPTAEKHGS